MFASLCLSSRVHITEATLNHLGKAYEVEEGNGHLRDPYLKAMNITTYLVIDPRVGIFLHISPHWLTCCDVIAFQLRRGKQAAVNMISSIG